MSLSLRNSTAAPVPRKFLDRRESLWASRSWYSFEDAFVLRFWRHDAGHTTFGYDCSACRIERAATRFKPWCLISGREPAGSGPFVGRNHLAESGPDADRLLLMDKVRMAAVQPVSKRLGFSGSSNR